MIDEIKAAAKEGDSLGGIVEVVAHGVPVGLKDLYATAGVLTTNGARICRDAVPREGLGDGAPDSASAAGDERDSHLGTPYSIRRPACPVTVHNRFLAGR